jgi:hypothetical protein
MKVAIFCLALVSVNLSAVWPHICGAAAVLAGGYVGIFVKSYADAHYSSEFSLTDRNKFLNFMWLGYHKAAWYAISGFAGLASMIATVDICMARFGPYYSP